MDRIHEQHLCEPGLMVLDITAADEATALAAMAELDRRWGDLRCRPCAARARRGWGQGALVCGHTAPRPPWPLPP
ncbi:DUF6207 family protein [Streptomyces sp. 7N604]|uniref:DUF6207 family protein n=1 Tax=Streptomyces sp. 7N604 TaxID=3457415 RepID=UPI003FD18F07